MRAMSGAVAAMGDVRCCTRARTHSTGVLRPMSQAYFLPLTTPSCATISTSFLPASPRALLVALDETA
jgi:hypothetical protein